MAGNPRKGFDGMQAAVATKKLNAGVKSKAPATRLAAGATARANAPAQAPSERHQNEGHGRRLTMAFEALEAFPALAESRDRLLMVISKDHVATADIVSAVESDVALSIGVLRMANQAEQGRARVD